MSYTLHGDYYLPDLVLNEAEPTYGMLRKQFLKEHRSGSQRTGGNAYETDGRKKGCN